jgi:hypothetical protein
MAKLLPYRRAFGEPALMREPAGFGRRWGIVAAFMLAVVMVVCGVAGGEAGAVFQTWGYAGFVVPLVVTAGMLGVAMTGAFAGCFEGSPWPDMYRVIVSVALGLGAYALGMVGLGAVHLLNPPWVPALMQATGAAIGFVPTRNFFRGFDWGPMRRRAGRGEWLVLLGAVPVGMAVIAATFPPGTLWGSEGNGYDVLEYHLQMPREYGWTNSIMPVAHNVYSYLPANVEMLYLLLMQTAKAVMGAGGDSLGHLWGVFPSQFLHLGLMLLTVAAVGLAPMRMNRLGRALAMVVVLAVPWTVITGSLAYDEWGMMLFGALALGIAFSGSGLRWGVLIGILLGLAVGCKLTAGIAFAVPVAGVLLLRGQWKGVGMAAGVALLLYLPWAVRAAVESGGNPIFPLAANVLGRDGWTAEQMERFNHGHAALEGQRSLGERIAALNEASVLDEQWSPGWRSIYAWAGERPPPVEMWWKHVGILWVVVPLAVLLALLGSERRTAALLIGVLAVQVGGWLFLTHLQSRFLLPIVVPLAMLCGIGVGGQVRARGELLAGLIRVVVWTVVGGQALCAAFLLLPEASLLGGVQKMKGRERNVPHVGELFERGINIAGAVEGSESGPQPEGKILLEGGATPLFWEGDIVYNTVFDRNLLGDALRAGGAEGAAKWLREQGINYVVFDWAEISRLHKTYGFDEAMTPEAMEGLVRAGIVPVKMEAPPGWVILRVAPTTGALRQPG